MKYILETTKTFEQVSCDLELAVRNNSFGVLHIHNMAETLRKKGFEFTNECRVFEVCNPKQASRVLNIDMSLNMALPCRISVWSENGKTKVGTISPKTILSMLSSHSKLVTIASEVEESLKTIIREAVGER